MIALSVHIIALSVHVLSSLLTPVDPALCPPVAGVENLSDHCIITGGETAFLPFVRTMRYCEATPSPVVILHAGRISANTWKDLQAMGQVYWVRGRVQDKEALQVRLAGLPCTLLDLTCTILDLTCTILDCPTLFWT
eukprot:6905822-Pyramimonas_sp.AAC.2